jgi:hypothetical protein
MYKKPTRTCISQRIRLLGWSREKAESTLQQVTCKLKHGEELNWVLEEIKAPIPMVILRKTS